MMQALDTKKKPADLLEYCKPEDHQRDSGFQLHTLLQLQRRASNRAVVGLLESHGQLQAKLRSSAPVGVIQKKCATNVSAVGAVSKLWPGAQGALGKIGRNAISMKYQESLRRRRNPRASN